MIVAQAEHHLANVTDDDFLRKCQRALEHNARDAEVIDAHRHDQKIDGLRQIDDAPDAVNLQGLVARLQTCRFRRRGSPVGQAVSVTRIHY